jgi:hypothetical protein
VRGRREPLDCGSLLPLSVRKPAVHGGGLGLIMPCRADAVPPQLPNRKRQSRLPQSKVRSARTRSRDLDRLFPEYTLRGFCQSG